MSPTFIPGLKLNESFYKDIVGPLMQEHFPQLKYSIGLMGHGSDVLGFDSPKSVDHNWGPRLILFLTEPDFIAYKVEIDKMLRTHLPYTYKGFSVNFGEGDIYLRETPQLKSEGEVNHLIRFYTIRSFFIHYLGFDIRKKPSVRDWLIFPQQALIEVTKGKVFHDDLGLEKVRASFSYYPDDVWKYMLSVEWGKIRDELQFQARSGEEGDELGSFVVAARTVQKIMFLSFLLERQYIPYSKWFGIAFSKWLTRAKTLRPLLIQILHEQDWNRRQKLLAKAYRIVAKKHNELGITKPISTEITDFHGRGYPVIDAAKFEKELFGAIKDRKLRAIQFQLGNVDQFIDHARINDLNYVYTELKDIIK